MIHVRISRWRLQLVLLRVCNYGQSEIEHAHEPVVVGMVGSVVGKHVEHVFLQLVAVLAGEYRLVLGEPDAAQCVVGASARETEPYITPWMVFVRYICGGGVGFNEEALTFFQMIVGALHIEVALPLKNKMYKVECLDRRTCLVQRLGYRMSEHIQVEVCIILLGEFHYDLIFHNFSLINIIVDLAAWQCYQP